MEFGNILQNPVLWSALIAWAIAQSLKVPLEYFRARQWNWSLLFEPGGMPSSHSSLVTACGHSIGLWVGFNSPLFALSIVVAMVVIYDATGIRRQAGYHAEAINRMIQGLASGHPLKGQELREVLGHTPLETLGGVLLGIFVAQVVWSLLR